MTKLILLRFVVGYGDFVPTTGGQRLFQAFLILLGVGVGTSLISILNDRISAHNEALADQRCVEMTQKLQDIASGVQSRKKSHTVRSGISSLVLLQESTSQDEETSHPFHTSTEDRDEHDHATGVNATT